MMKALVTGSTGFIGSALCTALVEKGFSVRAFHRSTSNLTLIKDLPVEHVVGDLTQPASLASAMQGIDVVFHTAAMLGIKSNASQHTATTILGTRSVMETALRAGVQRVIHTSSVAALGVPPIPSELTPPENSPQLNEHATWNVHPSHWLYGFSKYQAEMEIQKIVAQGLDVVITNPSYVVGPGDLYRTENSPIVSFYRKKMPFIPTGGINIVHIKDVVAGHLAAMEYGKRGERYILANENLTFKQMFSQLSTITAVPAPRLLLHGKIARPTVVPLQFFRSFFNLPVPVELIRFAGYGFYFNNRKSMQDLNLQYQHTASQAMQDAYIWFKNHSEN
jgi:dihydroflavonol-4-reductase